MVWVVLVAIGLLIGIETVGRGNFCVIGVNWIGR